MQIHVTHHFPALVNHLTDLQQRLNDDLTPLMEKIGKALEDNTRERFATKKSPDGVSWENLMPSTQAKKGNNNILVHSGDLASSILHKASSHKVVVGTPEEYGIFHQLGAVHMVARPFLGISSDDEQTINELIYDYLNGDL